MTTVQLPCWIVVITKLPANRLQKIILSLVHRNQYGFLKNGPFKILSHGRLNSSISVKPQNRKIFCSSLTSQRHLIQLNTTPWSKSWNRWVSTTDGSIGCAASFPLENHLSSLTKFPVVSFSFTAAEVFAREIHCRRWSSCWPSISYNRTSMTRAEKSYKASYTHLWWCRLSSHPIHRWYNYRYAGLPYASNPNEEHPLGLCDLHWAKNQLSQIQAGAH